MADTSYDIETRCCHYVTDIVNGHPHGAVSVPIYQTATFAHKEIGEHPTKDTFTYSRGSNPTRRELEDTLASLEGAGDCVATATGMAAIALVLELFTAGDHVICTYDLYGGAVRIFGEIAPKRQVSFSYVDTGDIAAVREAIRPNTKALYIETPSNPTMKVTDLREIKKLADEYNLLLIVDNTFLTPYFQRPLELGADIVVHSGTKYLAGHNDTCAGFICTSKERKDLAERIRYLCMSFGPTLAPIDSFLVLRGIKTLALRMERQSENAKVIAEWLKKHKKVKKVYYAGYGAMISFETDTEKTAVDALHKVKLVIFAESLGGVESLITYPMIQTHRELPKEQRELLGINEKFLRLSVGIENVNDIIGDLEQALVD
jgi:cystathionine gamma-synthase